MYVRDEHSFQRAVPVRVAFIATDHGEFVPSNADLRKMGAESEAVPQMVYRRVNFPDEVPPGCAWTNSHDVACCEKTQKGEWCEQCAPFLHGGAGIQRMAYEMWLQVSAREEKRPHGHDGPTRVGNLPRPKERGGEVEFCRDVGVVGGVRAFRGIGINERVTDFLYLPSGTCGKWLERPQDKTFYHLYNSRVTASTNQCWLFSPDSTSTKLVA